LKSQFSCSNVRRRSPDGRFYFRVRVPPELIPCLRTKELRFSLRTKSLAEATVVGNVIRERISLLFALGATRMLTDEQIRNLLVTYVRSALKYDEEKRAAGWELQGTVEDAGEVLNCYRGRIETLCDALIYADRQDATGGYYADLVLRSNGLTEPKDSLGYAKLRREVLKAQLEIVETQLSRFEGDYNNPHDSRFSYLAEPPAVSQSQPQGSASASSEPPASGPLLSQLVGDYVTECSVKESWTPKTTAENQAIYRILLGLLGDRAVTELTRDDITGVLAQIKQLPPNFSKKYPGKSVQEVLAAPDLSTRRPMAINTVQKYMRRIASLFKYAYQNGILPKHIAEGVNIRNDKRQNEERSPYSPEDIKKMFEALPAWVGRGVAFKHERFWIPLIGLHSGMRLNEICQLHVEDLREVNGVWCFDVNEEGENQRIKTKAGKRCVPIHPVLQEVGLKDYWGRMQDRGAERLWMGLTHSRDGYGQSFSKSFGKFNRKHVTPDPKKVFHSFRHTLANQLKQQECQEALICQILGHEYGGSESMVRYGKDYSATVLLATLKTVDFGLDVPSLKQFAASL
jgi:integrase